MTITTKTIITNNNKNEKGSLSEPFFYSLLAEVELNCCLEAFGEGWSISVFTTNDFYVLIDFVEVYADKLFGGVAAD